jgi:hypothetical protein
MLVRVKHGSIQHQRKTYLVGDTLELVRFRPDIGDVDMDDESYPYSKLDWEPAKTMMSSPPCAFSACTSCGSRVL